MQMHRFLATFVPLSIFRRLPVWLTFGPPLSTMSFAWLRHTDRRRGAVRARLAPPPALAGRGPATFDFPAKDLPMKPRSARLIGAALVAAPVRWAECPSAHGQPGITHATPGALSPGQTTEITLHGTKLDGPLQVWTSFPAQVEVTGDEKQKNREQVVCKVSLAAGVPVGIGGIVVSSLSGVSDVAFVMIDDLPSVADSGKNHAAAEAQEISLPAAIDGLCDGTQADYYRFTAKEGQRISGEVVATRLGWDFDPLVRVLDSSGNELLLADDDPATGADTRFVFTPQADGQYILELRDNRYKGGGRYRLRLGDFPLVAGVRCRWSHSAALPAAVGLRRRITRSGHWAATILPVAAGDATAVNLSLRKLAGTARLGWATLRTDRPARLPETAAVARRRRSCHAVTDSRRRSGHALKRQASATCSSSPVQRERRSACEPSAAVPVRPRW